MKLLTRLQRLKNGIGQEAEAYEEVASALRALYSAWRNESNAWLRANTLLVTLCLPLVGGAMASPLSSGLFAYLVLGFALVYNLGMMALMWHKIGVFEELKSALSHLEPEPEPAGALPPGTDEQEPNVAENRSKSNA